MLDESLDIGPERSATTVAPGVGGASRRRMLALLTAVVAIALMTIAGGVAYLTRSHQFTGIVIQAHSVSNQQLAALFAARAEAVRAGDEAAFLATVDTSEPALLAQERTEFANLRRLPLVDYQLRFSESTGPSYLDQWAPGTAYVSERFRVRGMDRLTTNAVTNYTVSVIGHRLLITDDLSTEPWAMTSLIAKSAPGLLLVVDRADRDRLAQLVRDAETALKADRPYWQAVWPHRFVLFATSDPNTFDQGWFDGSLGVDFGGYEFQQPSVTRGGKVNFQFGEPRVVVDLARATDNFALIHLLRHEFTHAATADVTKPNTATWVIEGYAEQVAWRGVQLADTAAYWDLLNPTVGPSMWRPPAGISGQDDRFYAGNVRRHYELAFLAFRFLQDNYGQQRTNAFYQAAQGEGPVPTDAYRLLGLTPESFLIHWRTWARDASGSGWGDLY